MADAGTPHIVENGYDPDSWWAYNEPLWAPGDSGEIVGNSVVWTKASDAVRHWRAHHQGTVYDQLGDDVVFFDWVVVNWAWRCNWPVREGMSP